MTPRMKTFLAKMAQCEPGKGWPPPEQDRRIASKAADEDYGMMIGFGGFMLFVINEKGRAALRDGGK